MNDWFMLESRIVERITTLVPELRRVAAAMDLDGVMSQGQIVPACYIIYGGDEPVPGEPEDGDALLDQYWLVVLAVRAGVREESSSREAGLLLARIDAVLRGWRPLAAGVIEPFARSRSPAPLFEDGFGYFVLRYRARVTFALEVIES
ncbi:MAG: hypothetical protein HQM01_10115 [Magnetococcales bacterium]|nr:hypothetical protein [Magnetococcales bacterium]